MKKEDNKVVITEIEKVKYIEPLKKALHRKNLMVNSQDLIEKMRRVCPSTSEMFYFYKGAMTVASLLEEDEYHFE